MAEDTATEPTDASLEQVQSAAEDMDLVQNSLANGGKREREDDDDKEENGDSLKKQKVDKSVEEERLEKTEGNGEGEGEQKKTDDQEGKEEKDEEPGPVKVGPKSFGSSVEMFDYFYKLLHYWPPNLNTNDYEHMVLLDLLKKGHSEPDKKIGCGIQAFQVQNHPTWKSRCFFLIRGDDSVDDFSFRKCVDKILPLPENMKVKFDANKSLSGRKGHGGKGGKGRGRGRGGKWMT
uniref:Protein DCLic n=1 Tax=Rhizophora mucronata TaxID=61149 RepID=A0A2P2QQ32_RHIMU